MVREGNTLQLVEQVGLTATIPHTGGEHLVSTGGREGGNENCQLRHSLLSPSLKMVIKTDK